MLDEIAGEDFDLPVLHNGREELLPARLMRMGYSYKIVVQVGECEVIFEPDEERNFRAVIENDELRHKIDFGLLRSVGEALEKNFR